MVDVRQDTPLKEGALLKADSPHLAARSKAVLGIPPCGHGYCPLHYSRSPELVVWCKCNLAPGIQDSCRMVAQEVPSWYSRWEIPLAPLDNPEDGVLRLDPRMAATVDNLYWDILAVVEAHLDYHASLLPVG